MFLKQELLNGVIPVGPPTAHLGLRDDPVSQRLMESVSVARGWCGEGPAEMLPYFPAGVIWFLQVDTLPNALGLDRFQVAYVDARVYLISLGIGNVRKSGDIEV